MTDIFQYSDYRRFLLDAYRHLKRSRPSGFTHRRIGQKGGFDPGLFSKVVQGERNISRKLIPGFCKAFALTGEEAKYFEFLVAMGQAKSEEERRRWERQLALEQSAFKGDAQRVPDEMIHG